MIEVKEFEDALSDVIDYLYTWEKEARVDFEFAALKQWDEEDKDDLEDDGRPALVFDRTRPIIASVAGAEITNRYEPKYLPRDSDLTEMDVQYSESGNKVYRWIRDRGDFPNHESAAFQSTLICGIGATELYVDFEEDRDGVIKMRRVPIWELGWDPSSVDPNLLDAKYVIRDRWVDDDEIIQRFGRDVAERAKVLADHNAPGKSRGFLSSIFTREVDDPRKTYFENRGGKYYDYKRSRIRVWEMVRKDKEYQTRILLPESMGGGDVMAPKEKAQEAIEALRAAQMTQSLRMMEQGLPPQPAEPVQYIDDFPVTTILRSYHAGHEVLKEEKLPMKHFPYQFITGFEDTSDPSRRYFFGLMRAMRDPQRYANKFFSHAVHMWASNPKGAILFENDLFDNPSQAREEWQAATGFISVAPGKLQTMKPKYEIIPNGADFRGIETLLQHAIMSVSAAAGVSEQYTVGNPADLRRTSGSAVQSVKESNLVTISQPFDALRLYKRVQGRLILDHVAAYVQESQLRRLLGQEEQEFIPAFKSGKLSQQYEVIAEEAPASKNKQMEVFAKIMETSFIPQLLEMGVTVPPELAKFFPFPPDINAEFERVLKSTKDMMELQNELSIMALKMQELEMRVQAEQMGVDLAGAEFNAGMEQAMGGAELDQMQMDQMMQAQQMMQPPVPGEEGPPPEGV